MPEQVEGVVESILFRREDTGFTIAMLKNAEGVTITLVGSMADVTAGVELRAVGEWDRHPQYGRQFRVTSYEIAPPNTVEGIRKYLASGMIRGIGRTLADRLVDHFGKDTLRIIEEEPERLLEVPNIGPKRLAAVREAWKEHQQIRELILFLHSHGLPAHLAVKVFRRYGEQAMSILRIDPYRLAREVYGIGFLTADTLARQLGIPKDSPRRLEAGISYVLQDMCAQSHMYVPESLLVQQAARLLEVEAPAVQTALQRLEQGGLVRCEPLPNSQEERGVYPPALYYHETSVARMLRRLAEQRRHALPFSPSDNWEAMFRQLDREAGLVLSEAQRQAVQAALTHPLTVLTGGPGTGKTTTLRAVLRLLEGKNCRLALVAPTGRAAKRLSEVTGYPAMTIHRLLGYTADGDFMYDERRPLPADMLIVDEASMLDVPLAYYLLRALLPETQVLFVGDADQLPPVQPGNFLRDLIDSGVAVVVRLQEIFRQAADSNIIRNAHRIHRGEMPLFPKDAGDFFLFPTEEPERAAELVVELVQERIPRRFGLHPLRDIQVLCPMYKGAAGVSNLNARLQAALNPPAPGKPERSFGIFTLRAGDKVMQLRNNYEKEVFNGDIGFVTDIDVEEQVIWVQMEDRRVPYDFGETDDLTLAYAISVHKSQGNEYPAVVLPLLTQHYMMLQRNLLYTAVTRARKLVVLVGSRRAISMAVNNARPAERYSLLKERLRGELPARPEGRLGDSDIVLLL